MILPVGIPPAVFFMVLILHVVGGFVGMYGGLVPLFTRKGGKAHRTWGIVFTWAMAVAAVTAFPLAWWRGSLFQAMVGLLSGYLTLFGFRVLRRYSKPEGGLLWDKFIALVCVGAFFSTVGLSVYFLWQHPQPEARAALIFGIIGLIVAGRDLQGLFAKEVSFARRVLDHLIASSLAVVIAFSAFLNTQFYRLTHVDWPQDAKMLLPVAVAVPLFGYWLPVWVKRLRTEQSTVEILRNSGMETSEMERIRAFGILEGITFLLLIGIAVPLKHIGGHPEFVRVMGSLHGAMFILYAVSVILAARSLRWPIVNTLLALGAGVVPCGTFFLEATWRKKQ